MTCIAIKQLESAVSAGVRNCIVSSILVLHVTSVQHSRYHMCIIGLPSSLTFTQPRVHLCCCAAFHNWRFIMASGYPLNLHVLCGNCQTVVGAPLGHPVVRCGNCSSLLRIGGAVRFGANHNLGPAVQQYLEQRQAAAGQQTAVRNTSKEASSSAIAALTRFSASDTWVEKEGNPSCVISTEGEETSGKSRSLRCVPLHATH